LLGSEVVQRASNEASDESPQKQIEMIGSDLLKLDKANSNFEYFEDLLNKEIERLEFRKKNPNYIPGIVTGYTDLDKYIDCFKPGQLIILAARPAMGKTAFCLNLMMSCLDNMNMKNQIDDKERQSAGLFSLEMSGEEMVQRVLSIKTEIPRKKYDNNIPLKEDKHIRDVYKAAKALQETPIFIDSEGGSPINKIKNKARILKRKHNLGILFIDYLQLIKGNTRKSDENRTQEITQITQELKALAKELEVPIIALSQLSRNVENRTDKTPHLADLRESGSIEQDADLVMFLYREEYYLNQVKEEDLPAPVLEKKEKVKNQADVIIAKQRDGPVGSFKLYFDSETNKFKNFKKVESWN
jgi:replicative DNA helicase